MTELSSLKKVFLFGHAQYRFFLLELAKRLVHQHKAEIHLYCATPQAKIFWDSANEGGLFASVQAVNILYRAAERPVADENRVVEEATELERWLGTNINSIAVSDRHLGRGFALGGFHHPRSRISSGTNYIQMISAFSQEINFWKKEFEEKEPDLVLNCGKVAAVAARKLGVPYRSICGSRFKNYHQWAHSEFFENPLIEERYSKAEPVEGLEFDIPYHAHMKLREKYHRDISVKRMLARSAHIAARHVYWRTRGYDKAKGYFPSEEIRYLWRRRSDIKLLKRLSVPLKSLRGTRFLYFPLHTEPETSLQMLSPEYFYQLSCIAALARDLPAGVKLAVKETFAATGRRPTDFYQQIAEFKNVVWIDMMELGLEVVHAADAVATITGTGGFEAAVLGKPVITFGRHNQYNFLPHVRLITDEINLKSELASLLSPDFDVDGARLSGARFLSSVLSVSFDMGEYDYINLERFRPEAVTAALSCLTESLA